MVCLPGPWPGLTQGFVFLYPVLLPQFPVMDGLVGVQPTACSTHMRDRFPGVAPTILKAKGWSWALTSLIWTCHRVCFRPQPPAQSFVVQKGKLRVRRGKKGLRLQRPSGPGLCSHSSASKCFNCAGSRTVLRGHPKPELTLLAPASVTTPGAPQPSPEGTLTSLWCCVRQGRGWGWGRWSQRQR